MTSSADFSGSGMAASVSTEIDISDSGMAATVSTETDTSGSGMAATVSTENTENVVELATEDGHQTKQPKKLFHIENTFVKSWCGIFLAFEMVLSPLGALCVTVANEQDCVTTYRVWTTVYSFYNFMAISCFVISIYLYGLKLSDFKGKGCGECFVTGKFGLSADCCYLRLNTIEMVTVGLLLLLFLIASIAVAVNTCGLAGYYAGVVFGFYARLRWLVTSYSAYVATVSLMQMPVIV